MIISKFLYSLMNNVSAARGPFTLIFKILSFFTAGIMILFSSDPVLNSALCGLRPSIPILVFY